MYWRPELASRRLVQPFDLISLEGSAYWLVYPEHRRNQPKIRAILDWVLAEVEALKATEPAEIFEPKPLS
jgi:LysR family glycine cleavage system transcriptional activator